MIADADLIAAAGSGYFDELGAGDIAATEAVSVHDENWSARHGCSPSTACPPRRARSAADADRDPVDARHRRAMAHRS